MATDVPLTHNWAANTWDWPLESHDGVVKVTNAGNKFEVGLAAREYKPEEIKVSVIGDDLAIHARHETRSDSHGTVSREVHRVYRLPADINKSTIKSHLTQAGILLITADKK